jgi:hypothetical protein
MTKKETGDYDKDDHSGGNSSSGYCFRKKTNRGLKLLLMSRADIDKKQEK